ncbi:hypothetical protein CDL12_30466 [Handroanthus impetiginosus]|uniref:Uncharacterized protein n=1 Tax=Handroanthus impetiginosus TaxID=429701 RepID=A0A2G9FVV4_9LAMI|nr:hypothetical protein CDL12_30466 [Handroanthus impetiginosus]
MTPFFSSYIDPGTYRSCLNHMLYASWMDPPKKIHDQENVRKTEHNGISTHINKNQAGKSYLKHEKSTSS